MSYHRAVDILWFLQRRVTFVRVFHEQASGSFLETKRKIEAHEPPFDDGRQNDSAESAYLKEWQDADEALEFLGQSCLSFAATSFKLYLQSAELEFRNEWGDLFPFPAMEFGVEKFVLSYESWFREFGIDFQQSGADINLLAEMVATRNLVQHPESIGLMHLTQRQVERDRFPQPFFAHPVEQEMFGREPEHDIPWMLSISEEALFHALDEVARFCSWLERERRAGPKQVPKSVKLPLGDPIGIVTNYFRKQEAAAIKLVEPLSVGDTVRFHNSRLDFQQQIRSIQIAGASINDAAAGTELALGSSSGSRREQGFTVSGLEDRRLACRSGRNDVASNPTHTKHLSHQTL